MRPNFSAEDYVLICAWPIIKYRKGDVVVLNHPLYNTVLKRISEVEVSKKFHFSSDNPLGVSGLELCWEQRDRIVGKVVWHSPQRNV